MDGPALAIVELDSIARGLVTVDAMAKKAEVHVVEASPIAPGRYRIEVRGGVGEVEAAHEAGQSAAGEALLDEVFLPQPHVGLLALLAGESGSIPEETTLGVVECYTSASIVSALDAALKAAEVRALRLERALHLGGKGWCLLAGALEDVDAALAAAAEAARPGMLQRIERVARPHPDVGPHFAR